MNFTTDIENTVKNLYGIRASILIMPRILSIADSLQAKSMKELRLQLAELGGTPGSVMGFNGRRKDDTILMVAFLLVQSELQAEYGNQRGIILALDTYVPTPEALGDELLSESFTQGQLVPLATVPLEQPIETLDECQTSLDLLLDPTLVNSSQPISEQVTDSLTYLGIDVSQLAVEGFNTWYFYPLLTQKVNGSLS